MRTKKHRHCDGFSRVFDADSQGPGDRPKSPPKTLYLLAPYKLVAEYVTFNLFWVQ